MIKGELSDKNAWSTCSGIIIMNKGYIYLLITAFAFGTFEVASKMVHGIDPPQLNFLRFLIGGLTLLPFAVKEIRKKQLVFTKTDAVKFTGLGILLVPISMVFFQIGIKMTSASVAAFVFSSNPIFVALFAWFLLSEKPDKFIVISIIMGVIGLFFITNPFTGNVNIYILYLAIAGITFALYTVLMRKVTKQFGNLVSTTIVVNIGMAVLGAVLALQGTNLFKGISVSNIFFLLYLGILCSGIAYVAHYKGMELTSTNVGSLVFFIKPMLSTVFAVIILGEKLTGSFLAGAAFIIVGSSIMIYSKERHNRLKKVRQAS